MYGVELLSILGIFATREDLETDYVECTKQLFLCT